MIIYIYEVLFSTSERFLVTMRKEYSLKVDKLLYETIIKDKPLISCIVPAYNVGSYLERCINSLINQTYTNFEIIIVNDGSTDSTGEKIEKYRNHSKVKIITQANQGLSAARNTGIANALGTYITFVDSDDWVDRDYFKVMIAAAIRFGADIISVKNDICSTEVEDDAHNDDDITYTDSLCGDTLFSFEVTNFAWGKLFKKKLIYEGFFPIGRTYEDVGSIYKAYDKCERHVSINGRYYHYFLREGSITSERMICHVKDRIHFLKEMISYNPGKQYQFWNFYIWVKSFAAMSDLYKVKNITGYERKQFRNEIYQCVEKLKITKNLIYTKKHRNNVRVLLMKFRLAHIFLGLLY